ncbi:MAG TPA: hypothetical protein DCM40_11275 [Maribacter sp.]|nr:hypothetical protein [Maribacter sp.]
MAYGRSRVTDTRNQNNTCLNGRVVRSELRISDGEGGMIDLINQKNYTESNSSNYFVDNSDSLTTIAGFSNVKSTSSSISPPKAIVVHNSGLVPLEIGLVIPNYDSSDEGLEGTNGFVNFMLMPNHFYFFQSPRILAYNAATSTAAASSISDYLVSDSLATDFKVDSGVDSQANPGTSGTSITLSSGHNKAFRVGDIIIIGTELMRVDEIVDTTSINVTRAFLGSTAASYGTSEDIHFYTGNHLVGDGKESDSNTNVRTDASGRYAGNPFKTSQVPRTTSNELDGIVAGSFYIRTYDNAYQTLGLTNIFPTDSTGLATSTTYAINVETSLGTDTNISFSTGTNINYGGVGGVLSVINKAFTDGGYDYEVLLEGGEVKFYHKKALKDDFIKIIDPSSGTTPFGVGNIPADTDFNTKLRYARLADDTYYDKETGIEQANLGNIIYDNGSGDLIKKGQIVGSINYDTGFISFTDNYRTEFVVGYNVLSAMAGKMKTATATKNTLISIEARSMNEKVDGKLRIVTYS